MSNTPGQEPPPRPIDAQALQDQLIEFMLDTALRQKRFQNLISLMEEVVKEAARAKPGDDVKGALEQLRKDLARTPLREITTQIAASEARVLKELTQTRALVSSAGSSPSSYPAPDPTADLDEIKTRLARLETLLAAALKGQPLGAAIPPPSSAETMERPRQISFGAQNLGSADDSRRPPVRSVWPAFLRSPLTSLLSLLVAAAAVAAMLMAPKPEPGAPAAPITAVTPAAQLPTATDPGTGAADTTERESGSPAVSSTAASAPTVPTPSAWDLAWSSALVQPAICPGDPQKERVAFAHCVCPNSAQAASLAASGGPGTPVADLPAKCPLDEKDAKWNTRLAVAALQTVLMTASRVEGKAPGRADGDLGDHTIAAVKVLGACQSLAQAEGRALGVLENKASSPDEQGTAALKLLAFLKGDPSCLSADSAPQPSPQGAQGSRSAGPASHAAHSAAPRHP